MFSKSLKRWHGRMGVIAASFVLLLSITGLCLNHVSSWGFDTKALQSPSLLALYGMAEVGTVVSYPLTDAYISESNGQLFYHTKDIGHCDGSLAGAVALSSKTAPLMVVACGQELLLFSPTFQLIEKVGAAFGLPLEVQRIGLVDNELLVDTSSGLFFADLHTLTWTAIEEGEMPRSSQWSESALTPETLKQELAKSIDREDITYERLLLDIHSGRIFGEWGTYLVDAMALLFMLLAISGLILWRKDRKT